MRSTRRRRRTPHRRHEELVEVAALDVEHQGALLAQRQDAIVQRPIACPGGHVIHAQVGGRHRGEDPEQGHTGIEPTGAAVIGETDPELVRIFLDEGAATTFLRGEHFETIDNSANANSFKGAGIGAATMIHDRGAQVLVTGYCGPKAFQTLQAAGIRVVSDVSGTVGKALERFKSGEIEYLESANVESHW